ncbi:unnamed protein product, partial [Rotaria sp. Silwood1]
YLRCDIETKPDKLCLVLFGVWGMAAPGLIMRMIGDAESTPSIKLEKELLKGISDAAVASVPLITLLVGGTLHALSSICTDLEKLIPIVVVDVS